jgi:hypothetical protein
MKPPLDLANGQESPSSAVGLIIRLPCAAILVPNLDFLK